MSNKQKSNTPRLAALALVLCLLLAACSNGGGYTGGGGGTLTQGDSAAKKDAAPSADDAPAENNKPAKETSAPASQEPEAVDEAAPAGELEAAPAGELETADPLTAGELMVGLWSEDISGSSESDRYLFDENGIFTYAADENSAQALRYSTGIWYIEDDVLCLSATRLAVRSGGVVTERSLPASERIVEDYPMTFLSDDTVLLDDIRLRRTEDAPAVDLENFRDGNTVALLAEIH